MGNWGVVHVTPRIKEHRNWPCHRVSSKQAWIRMPFHIISDQAHVYESKREVRNIVTNKTKLCLFFLLQTKTNTRIRLNKYVIHLFTLIKFIFVF